MENNKIDYRKFFYIGIALLILSIIFTFVSCDTSNRKINLLNDSLKTANVENSLLSDSLRLSNDNIAMLKVLIMDCDNEKSIEKFKKRQYESKLQNFEDDCEHEKNALLFNNRINNSTDNELGLLLSKLGQYISLSDAERIFLSKPSNTKSNKPDT